MSSGAAASYIVDPFIKLDLGATLGLGGMCTELLENFCTLLDLITDFFSSAHISFFHESIGQISF